MTADQVKKISQLLLSEACQSLDECSEMERETLSLSLQSFMDRYQRMVSSRIKQKWPPR